MQIVYQSEEFAKINNWNYYSVDESLFAHDLNQAQIWVLGIINNTSNLESLQLEIEILILHQNLQQNLYLKIIILSVMGGKDING